ncbi:MAG: amidohydrolase family protein [Gammaproteobacteria bacterium]|nr:amidohydrolase family protein [Gammaproteobacteria bacterium]
MIFDAHFHIIDKRFPLVANKGFLPQPFSVGDYQTRVKNLTVKGGAVVSGSFQQFDQSYLIAALKALGNNFVGVTQLPADVSDEEILALNRCGVRALRFNLYRGGSATVAQLAGLAQRVYDLAQWHVELYVDSNTLSELQPLLLTLPKVSIDHLGLSQAGFVQLLELVAQGVHVKASGFMRVDFDVVKALQQIYAVNPAALMFGSDLPGTRASRQFSQQDLQLIKDNFDQAVVEKILWHNGAEFYRI